MSLLVERPLIPNLPPTKLVAVTIPEVMFVTAMSGEPLNPAAVPEVF